MDNCKHINRISPAADHSILNPEKWLCSLCGTTESVWACLSCCNVACGRYNEEHALIHYKETKHPIALEVNEKYVYCYECEEYVLNDNAAGDIKILRSALSAITTQSFHDIEARGRRILRSHSFHGFGNRWEEKRLRAEDLSFTALKFRRYYLLAKAFTAWKVCTKFTQKPPMPVKQLSIRLKKSESTLSISTRPKRAIVPGVTGLRNLGNTCYMNSVLQVLSHLPEFRKCIGELNVLNPVSTIRREHLLADAGKPNYKRQTTMECFQHVSEGNPKKGGLNGGSSSHLSNPRKKTLASAAAQNSTLVCELHALLRVLWSGKWALVSPHKMLHAVWNHIPFFKGFSQQDAQEFLCEFLDKLQTELERLNPIPNGTEPCSSGTTDDDVTKLFQGQLVSQVTCKACKCKSQTKEPFMDLSLEFPDHIQSQERQGSSRRNQCHIEEMLSKFTEVEQLDGEIYACENCNGRRRRASSKPTVYTEAEKRLLIYQPPKVLRLHLKRFMWSGRNHRGKIPAHVNFNEELSLAPYCHPDYQASSHIYQLDSVVMHHGKGFGSGHYTSYCYNEEAESWVHCNDSRMELCSIEDVLKSQAYILVYTQRARIPEGSDTMSDASLATTVDVNATESSDESLFEEEADDEITFNFWNSNIPKFVALKRRLSETEVCRPEVKRRKSTLW